MDSILAIERACSSASISSAAASRRLLNLAWEIGGDVGLADRDGRRPGGSENTMEA